MTFDSATLQAHPTVELEAIGGEPRRLLLEIHDHDLPRRVPIDERPLVVGSRRGADVVIQDEAVSARHCEIAAEGTQLRVRDLGSCNGTWIDGARLRDGLGWARPGTAIHLGESTLVGLVDSNEASESDDERSAPLASLAGGSRAMRRLAAQVRRLASVRAPVLIRGESGVGKELIARALHSEGPRLDRPFIALNASTIPKELAETELFGHERGAFTGAVAKRLGVFAEADGGTLFLDEIADLSIDAQPKLLRVLDGYEVRSVGAEGAGRRTDVRVVTATHLPLAERVAGGQFRKDLYHRLEVFVLEVPPLRERRGDILPIAKALLVRMGSEYGPGGLTPAAVAILTSYDWPGNVRELHATLMRASVDAKGRGVPNIDGLAVRRALRRKVVVKSAALVSADRARALVDSADGNISAAARLANIPRSTFRKLLERLDDA